jgi:imidazolonepropionase-like amidohydrolase
MPTASAENHIETHKRIHTEFPKTKEKLIEEIPLKIVDQKGNLVPQISQICQLIARADIILGTGHLYLDEIRLLVDEAIKQGVKKILFQHPEFLIDATIDDMIEFADKGVFIEHSMVFYIKNIVEPEYLKEMVRKVGAERTVLGSDLGQLKNPLPMDGYRQCLKLMLEMGITEEEIDLMIRKNPAKLLNLD